MPMVAVHGYEIAFHEEGSGRGVLLLHGMAGASSFWTETRRRLSREFRAISPDLLGFGDSDKPRIAYSISSHAELIRDFTETLGLGECDLIGHSMGGMIAVRLALACPEKVGRLILINVPVSGGRGLHGRGRLGVTLPGLALVKMGLEIPWVLWALRRLPRYYYVLDPTFTADARKASFQSLKTHAKAVHRTDLGQSLKEIRVSTLVMGTDRDGIVRPSQFSLAARQIKGAESVTIEGAGHCPTLEKPEESHDAILEFLKRGDL